MICQNAWKGLGGITKLLHGNLPVEGVLGLFVTPVVNENGGILIVLRGVLYGGGEYRRIFRKYVRMSEIMGERILTRYELISRIFKDSLKGVNVLRLVAGGVLEYYLLEVK